MKSLRDRVRTKLKRQGLNQTTLAAELGISISHLSQILAGKRTPSLGLALQLADRTGLPVSEFAEVA